MFSPYATPSATREVLERHGLSLKKSLGQNFLINDAIIGKIVSLASIEPADVVLEVGPGIGTLTYALLEHAAHVVSIERDPALPAVLETTLADFANKFSLIEKDALYVTPADMPAGILPSKFVANLPYAVAATVVLDYFQQFGSLGSATVMVQREVAERMMASPGNKNYGAYTVKLSMYAKPAGSFLVAPSNFMPPPHVDSTVLRLDRCVADVPPQTIAAVCTMADAAFFARRKTIANSCKQYFSGRNPEVIPHLPEIFSTAGVDPKTRGETLTKEEFFVLGSKLQEIRA